MNILLFAPALLILLLATQGLPKTIAHLALCAIIQVSLLNNSLSYIVCHYTDKSLVGFRKGLPKTIANSALYAIIQVLK